MLFAEFRRYYEVYVHNISVISWSILSFLLRWFFVGSCSMFHLELDRHLETKLTDRQYQWIFAKYVSNQQVVFHFLHQLVVQMAPCGNIVIFHQLQKYKNLDL